MTPSSTVSARPPTPPADRQRAVALRPHLGQAARLVLRRHEEHVGAGHQPVLQPVGEVELRRRSGRARTRAQLDQRLLVALLAAAEEDELRVERRAGRQLAEDEVEPLLRRPAGRSCRRAGSAGAAAARTSAAAPPCSVASARGAPPSSCAVICGSVAGIPHRWSMPLRIADQPVAQRDEHVVQAEAAAGRAQLVAPGSGSP